MQPQILLWNQPEWISGAHRWINQAARQAGLTITGPVEQPYVRPWSTVMRVPTTDGAYFFKAAMPLFAFEPALLLALAAASPRGLLQIAAADTRRGWMLMRDAGTPMRQLLKSVNDLPLLEPVLPLLAELQMLWMGRADELIGLGVLDQRIERLPERFERLAARRDALLIGPPHGLSEAQYEQLRASVPRYAALCERLAGFAIRQSLVYDDMHTSNIFLKSEDGSRRITMADWGDSYVGHPFSSLLIFLRAVGDRVGMPEEATETPEGLPPELARLRDIYLDSWLAYESRASLLEVFNLAWRAGMVARALNWHETIQALDEPFRAEYRYTVPAWLGEYLLTL